MTVMPVRASDWPGLICSPSTRVDEAGGDTAAAGAGDVTAVLTGAAAVVSGTFAVGIPEGAGEVGVGARWFRDGGDDGD